jgi:ClpP class serine protease
MRSAADAEREPELATGEVISGRQAVAAGLADQLGTLEDAVRLASGDAGVAPRWGWYMPRRSMRARLVGRLAADAGEELAEVALGLGSREPRF